MADSSTSEETRERIVVLGLGNLLRSDEGLGVRAAERMQERYMLPAHVQIIDGGTLGLDLLCFLEEAACVLILDAALTDGPPGTLLRAEGDEVPSFLGMHTSPHEIALPDLLAITQLRGTTPRELVVLGMQPETIELGWGLSQAVDAHMDALIEAAVRVLEGWSIVVESRTIETSNP
jgi:hydrogenase maturation protease